MDDRIENNNLKNFSLDAFDEYNAKLTVISKQEAEELYKQNVRPNMFHFAFKPFFKFCQVYFLNLSFLKGKKGFIYAYIQSFAIFKRYTQLWLLYRNLN